MNVLLPTAGTYHCQNQDQHALVRKRVDNAVGAPSKPCLNKVRVQCAERDSIINRDVRSCNSVV